PAIDRTAAQSALEQQQKCRSDVAMLQKLSIDAMFGLFCLYAPLVEVADEQWVQMLPTELPTRVTAILQSRGKAGEAAGRIGPEFSQTQRDLINRWVGETLSLTR